MQSVRLRFVSKLGIANLQGGQMADEGLPGEASTSAQLVCIASLGAT